MKGVVGWVCPDVGGFFFLLRRDGVVWSEENAVSGFVEESWGVYGGCLKVVCSPPAWMCCMIQSAWSNPSTVPMTATCWWMSGRGRGGRNVFGDQWGMTVVGCVPIVRLEE